MGFHLSPETVDALREMRDAALHCAHVARRRASEGSLRLEIAARLRRLRDAVNPNASKMARSLGLTPQTWYSYETGRRALKVEIAARLVEAYGVNHDWLYKGRVDGLSPMLRAALAPDEEPTAESACRERRAGRRP